MKTLLDKVKANLILEHDADDELLAVLGHLRDLEPAVQQHEEAPGQVALREQRRAIRRRDAARAF